MDPAQRAFYRLYLENAIRRADGTAFQNLFADIMEQLYGGQFIRVRPYGRMGDLKCDGYLLPDKTVFQCYAPRTMRQSDLLGKIDEDYQGAISHWGNDMIAWEFVHNDFDGLPPEATRRLITLRTNAIVGLEQLPPSELISKTLSLPISNLADLFGPVPTLSHIDDLTFKALQPVLVAIARRDPGADPPLSGPSREKLQRNALSEAAGDILRLGRRRERLVEEYLMRYPEPEYGEQIAEGFRRKYEALKSTDSHSADEIFGELWRYAGGSDRGEPTHQAAVPAVLSYFFERCDIFEDTPEQEGQNQ
jgi:C-terminal domain 10 of the ABC-three component (ABC-3C) systems